MRFLVAVVIFSFGWLSCANAQSPNDMIDIFGGLVRSGLAAATQPEWAKLPPAEINCIDRALSRRGLSVNSAIQQGIRPSDPRVFAERSSCRGTGVADRAGETSPPSNYSIDGMSLGGRIDFGSAAFGNYACSPSEQFQGFSVCRKHVDEREARGLFVSNYTILHAADGTIAYLNRTLEPAFFKPGEAEEDIERLSKKHGAAQILRIPQGSPIPYGMIAIWGQIKLEPLDPALVSELAANLNIRAGFLVSYVGSFRRAAQLGLPIYRLSGGPGFIWIASWANDQRGVLRFLAANPSAYDRSVNETTAAGQPNDGKSSYPAQTELQAPAKPPIEDGPAQKAVTALSEEESAAAAKKEADRIAAEQAAAKAKLEREEAERVAAAARAAAIKAAAEENQRKKDAEFRAKGVEFVESSNTDWVATSKLNEMTDKNDIVVRSFQKNENAAVEVVGSCENGLVTFSGLVVDSDGKAIRVIHSPDVPKAAPVLYRFNEEQPINRYVPELEFNNKFELVVLGNPKDVQTEANLARIIQTAVGVGAVVPPSKLWRVMVQFRTVSGEIIAKIPIFAEPIQQLISSCVKSP